jgi:DNA-binding MarR family transcriptional regulator
VPSVPPPHEATLRTVVEAPAASRRAFSTEVRREFALNELPLQVLSALALYGPLGGTEIATRLALSRGSVSSLLADLAARGLVTTVADARDRRRRTAQLTPAGQGVVADFIERAARALGDDGPTRSAP